MEGAPQTQFDAEQKAAFVLAYERSGEKKAAAAAVGVTRQTIYNHLAKDSQFVADCEAARGRLLEKCISRLKHLAIDGVTKTTYDKDGNKVSVTKIYSERMLLAWLKRLEREKWGDRVDVNQKVSGTVEHRTPITQVPKEARTRLRDALAELPDLPSQN